MGNHFSSSLSKKLMAITMLLLLIVTTAIALQTGCSPAGPIQSGPCKDDYSLCVANVITVLRDRTPYEGSFSTYYPADDQPASGGVSGNADCSPESTFNDCRSCLIAAKDWLDQNCVGFAGGNYSGQGNNCFMMYGQAFG